MLQSLEKILSVDHDIKACIILGDNGAKITHLAQKKIFLKKFCLNHFYIFLCPIMQQNWKVFRADPEI